MSRWRPEKTGAVMTGMGAAHAEYRVARASKARSRARGISSLGSNADYHYRSEADYLRIIELARDCDRNDQVVGQAINRLVNMVFRDGITADPDTGNTDLDAIIAADWKAWAEDRERCDCAGERSLQKLARLGFRHTVVDGDVQFLLLRDGTLQPSEGHRLRTPQNVDNDRRTRKVVHGIELDEARRHLNYWFTKDPVGLNDPVVKVGEVVKRPARTPEGYRNVLHLYRPERLSQTRGISALSRILETAGQHDDLQWAQLVKANVAACFAIFRERAANVGLPTGSAAIGPRTEETNSTDDFVKILEQLAPGMILEGQPGEKLQGFSAAIPNEEYFKHVSLILSIIAVNLDIPVIVLLLDPSATNFSGWRGAMDAAKPALQRFRADMIEQFYQPIYQWRVRRLLDENPRAAALAQRRKVNPLGVGWKPPHDPYIEPLKDAEADKVIITEGLNSRRNVLASRGLDIEVVDRHRVQDRGRLLQGAFEEAERLRALGMDDITWRDLIPSDTKSEQMIHVAQIEKATAEEVAEEGEDATADGTDEEGEEKNE